MSASFGPCAAGHVRVSIATSLEILEERLTRLGEAVRTWNRKLLIRTRAFVDNTLESITDN